MLWVDFDLKEFFGGSQARPSSPHARELSFDNLQVRESFLTNLGKFTHENLRQRIYRLEIKIKFLGINDELVRKYNSITRDLIQSIRSAARKLVEQKQHGYA